MSIKESLVGFDPSRYDLADPQSRAAYIRDWAEHLKQIGFPEHTEVVRDEDGFPTLEWLAGEVDAFTQEMSIILRLVIDQAGGRETEAGSAISGLWHGIIAHNLLVHRTLMHQLEKPAEEARG